MVGTVARMAGLAVICGIVVAGCSLKPIKFTKPGTDQQTFMQDRFDCIQQSKKQTGHATDSYATLDVVLDRGVYIACMAARGYTHDPDGTLFPPPGTEVRAG